MLSLFFLIIFFRIVVNVVALTVVDLNNYLEEKRIHGIYQTPGCLLLHPGEVQRANRTSGIQSAWRQAQILSGDHAPRLQIPAEQGKSLHP